MKNTEPAESPAQIWPLVTINILAFNRREEVRQTLGELQSVDYPREALEILVVDNASSDGTGEMIAEEFPDVRVVTLAPNRAVAGWNAGFEAGRGEFFLVLDDDSAPQSGLKEAIVYLQENPKVGILACNIVGGLFTTQKLKDGQKWVGFVGCGALIRREVVNSIGGYAPWIHLYAHEWEYGLRCLNAGFEIRYFQQCLIRHRASSVNRSSRLTVSYTTRNELLIVFIYFGQRRTRYLVRTVLNNAWLWWNIAGRKSFVWVLEGLLMFLRTASQHKHCVVRPPVQGVYARTFWSTQPLLPRIAKKLARLGRRVSPFSGT